MVCRVVVDTNIFVSACLSSGSAHQVVRACLAERCKPLMGAALLTEYEDLLGRDDLLRTSPLSPKERSALLDIFLSGCEWTRVYFGWRPNLPDEADNHLIELAVAGAAPFIVTGNLRDFARADLRFPGLSVVDPQTFLKEIETWQP